MELHNPKYPWFKYLCEINIERNDELFSYGILARALIFDQVARDYQTTYGAKCGKWKISGDEIKTRLRALGGFCFTKNKKDDYSCWAWANCARAAVGLVASWARAESTSLSKSGLL